MHYKHPPKQPQWSIQWTARGRQYPTWSNYRADSEAKAIEKWQAENPTATLIAIRATRTVRT